MTQRLYSLDENLALDWVDIEISNPIPEENKIYRKFEQRYIYFKIVNSKDGNINYKFYKSWIHSEGGSGVWHKNTKLLAKHLREIAAEAEQIHHPF